MFNTIVPPNSTQYPWASCRNGCLAMRRGIGRPWEHHAGHQQPPRRLQRGDGRWPRPVHQELDLDEHVVAARHKGQRRGDQLGLVLIRIGFIALRRHPALMFASRSARAAVILSGCERLLGWYAVMVNASPLAGAGLRRSGIRSLARSRVSRRGGTERSWPAPMASWPRAGTRRRTGGSSGWQADGRAAPK